MISITPSHIIEYLFCPRYTYFEYVLNIPQNEEKYYKVMKGRNIHDTKLIRNTEYLRKKIGIIDKKQEVYITNDNLRGKVDEVLWLNDGTMASLDYKFAKYNNKIYQTYKQQAYCYALLIEENYKKPVNKAFLVYTRSKNKLIELEITNEHKKLIVSSIDEILKIIDENFYPKATKYKKRCVSCTYKNICVK